jgi:ligand-binding sensor domain-containing protein
MKKPLKIFHLLLFYLTALNPLVAQNASYKFYTPHDGLTQSQVQCIMQDSRGYIWLGTQNGVSFFDGVKFHNLTVRDGFPLPVTINIAEDTDGTMWFTTKNFLCHFDGKNVTYDTVLIPNARMYALNHFCIDNKGNKWLLNETDGLLYFNKKSEKKWQCISDEIKELRMVSQIYYSQKEDRLTLASNRVDSTLIYSFDINNKKLKLLKKIHKTSTMSIGHGVNNSRILTYNDSIFAMHDDTLTFKYKSKKNLQAAADAGGNTFIGINQFNNENICHA